MPTYHPQPWEMAMKLWKWGANEPHGIPIPSDQMVILHAEKTSDKQARLEVSQR